MKYRILNFLFFAAVTIMASCKNKDLPPPTALYTRLNVSNATGDTIKYFINGTRQNQTSDIFAGGSTRYLTVLSGTQLYRFNKTTNGSQELFSTNFTLDTAQYYSIFIGGPTADQTFLTLDPVVDANALLATDTLFTTSVIRFVNATPDAGNLEVTVGLGDTVRYTNCAFKFVGNYKLFTGGAKEVKVYVNGAAAPKIDTLITFSTSQVYTLYTRGQLAGTGTNTFGISLTN